MFTGIVEEIGEVVAVREHGDVVVLTVRGRTVTADAGHGDSIAVNGVCLTVVDPEGSVDGTFTVELVPETLKRSSLAAVTTGARYRSDSPMHVTPMPIPSAPIQELTCPGVAPAASAARNTITAELV